MLRALFLDLDQTLLDRTQTFARYIHRQFADLQLEQYGLTVEDYYAEINRWDDNGYRPKPETFGLSLQHLKLPVDRQLLLDHFSREYGKDAQLFPGVKEALADWSQRFPLALITNGRQVGQQTKLQVTGIDSFFQTVCISEALGMKKPDPAIYQAACMALNVIPEEVVFVGDHPIYDVEAPKSLGMRAVWVRNSAFPEPKECDGVIDRVTDLFTVIEA